MGMNTGEPGGYNSEINVTPLVDVVLVLLIIFMMIVPLTLRGYDLDIPKESTEMVTEAPADEQIVLEITVAACPVTEPPEAAGLPTDCTVRVNDEEVPVTRLAPHIAAIFARGRTSEPVLFLEAEENLNYEGVMRIVDLAKSRVEGLRIGLVTG